MKKLKSHTLSKSKNFCFLVSLLALTACSGGKAKISSQYKVKNKAEAAISNTAPVLAGVSTQVKTGGSFTCESDASTASTKLKPVFYFYTSRGNSSSPKSIINGTIGQTSATYLLITKANETRSDIQPEHAGEVDEANDRLTCQVKYIYPNETSFLSPMSQAVVVEKNAMPPDAPSQVTLTVEGGAATAYASSKFFCEATGSVNSSSYLYSWKKNGIEVDGQTTASLSGQFVGGDVIACAASATADGFQSSSTTSASTITVANTAPVAPTVTLAVQNAATPTKNSTLTCAATSTDADGQTVGYLYYWYKNGTIINGQSANTLAGQFQKVDSLVCKVQASDGVAASTIAASSPIVILNSAPSAPSTTISIQGGGPSAFLSSTLNCAYTNATDPDSDALSYAYKWYKNNTVIAGQTVSSLVGQFAVADVVKCAVVANDSSTTTEGQSSTVTIQNLVPVVSAFVVKDTSTLLPNYTNNTSVTAELTGTNVASYCITTVNTAPTSGDACWSASTTQTLTATASATTTFYAWGKGTGGNISPTSVSSAITHSTFTEYAGATSASSTVSKHIKVLWTAASTPNTFDRYHVYVSTTSGGQNFSTPTLTVTGVSTTSAVIGGLNDNTTYYVVVRAATSTLAENNSAEVSATTPTMPSIATLDAATLYPALATHFDFNLTNIAIGEVVTIAGLYDLGFYKGTHIAAARSISNGAITAVVVDSSDNVYYYDYSNYVLIKVNAGTQVASVYSGTGIYGASGDGGPASSARLGSVAHMAIDSANNIYLADADYNKVRKITASTGIITTIAGTGSAGYTGDGGPATSAKLYNPGGVAVNSTGEVYIADWENGVIRKIATNGNISTYIGGGSHTGDGGAATAATVHNPRTLAFDSSDNLYITEFSGHRVRKVTASTGVISTIAGTGVADATGDGGAATSATLSGPFGIVVAPDGTVYVSEHYNLTVRKIAPNGTITRFAGRYSLDGYTGDGGAATNAKITVPRALALNSAGDLLISSAYDRVIRRVLASDGTIDSFAGSGLFGGYSGDGGQATSARVGSPYGIAKDSSGNIFFAEYNTCVIRKITPAGVISRFAGRVDVCTSNGDNGTALNAGLENPRDIAIDSAGNVYVTEPGSPRIRKILADGSLITTYAGTGVSSSTGDGGQATSATLATMTQITFDSSDNMYIAESGGHRIRKISSAGVISTVAGTGVSGLSGNGGAATSAQLNSPYGVVLDSNGNLYISDYGNGGVRKVTASTGVISSFSSMTPFRMGIDLATTTIYGVEEGGTRILKVSSAGGASTAIAGTTTWGYAGDGGPAATATYAGIRSIFVDSSANIFLTEGSNYRVRAIRGK